ncbi:hypothetical protein MRX96_002690 [Rhipicephalus microplus]
MVIGLTIAGICIVLLLERLFRVQLQRTTRLLLRQYHRHYHIEAQARGVGTALAVVPEPESPTQFGSSLVLVACSGLIFVCAVYRWHRSRLWARNQQQPERSAAAHGDGNADDMSEASWSSYRSSAVWTQFQDDELLDYELSSTPGSSGFAVPYRLPSRTEISLKSGDRLKKVADGRNSEIFRVRTGAGDSVLKVAPLDLTPDSHDRLIHEIKTASSLSDLRNGLAYHTDGFVELKSVNCVFDSYPEKLLKAREKEVGSKQKYPRRARESGDGEFLAEESDLAVPAFRRHYRTPWAYLVWHMSYAGVPLDKIEVRA